MIICSNCGAQINGTVNFCPNCGNQLPVQNTVPVAPVQISSEPIQNTQEISPKSRLAALLLGIFLGRFGVHNFYLGRIGRGIAQLIMFLLGFSGYMALVVKAAVDNVHNISKVPTTTMGLLPLIFVLISAPSIWSLVEWILVACGKMTDGKKLPVLKW